jgi:hypothetical protein
MRTKCPGSHGIRYTDSYKKLLSVHARCSNHFLHTFHTLVYCVAEVHPVKIFFVGRKKIRILLVSGPINCPGGRYNLQSHRQFWDMLGGGGVGAQHFLW